MYISLPTWQFLPLIITETFVQCGRKFLLEKSHTLAQPSDRTVTVQQVSIRCSTPAGDHTCSEKSQPGWSLYHIFRPFHTVVGSW